MKEFLVLFKHELKMLFPILSFNKKRKYDYLGLLLSLLLSAAIVVVLVMLVSKIAEGYITVKVNKILNPNNRATELLNILYFCVIIFMVIGCIRKMSATLTLRQNKEIYLRLPVKEQTLFLSKFASLLVWNLVTGALLILPINIIFYIVLRPSFIFFVKTLFIMITMPVVVFGIATVFVVPVIKILNFLKNKYLLIFVLISGLLIGVFFLYSNFLEIVKLWLETGSIRFLFNNSFVSSMQGWLKWAYPSNCFANIMMGNKLLLSFVIVILFVALAVAIAFFVSNKLLHITLYRTEQENKIAKAKNKYKKINPVLSLMKKEFICVYRNPKHLFSYFAIAVSMPVMAYCCFTLFESLIKNALGIKISFSLALLVLLMFSILTNTFCATNVTRDGLSFLKMKTFAINPSKLLLAKVLFCGIVSALSVLISGIVLIWATNLTILEGLLNILIVIPFSFAQILVATRLDLNHAKLSSNLAETESASNKIITKVVFLGLLLALITGVASVVCLIMSNGVIFAKFNLKEVYAYIIPIIICTLYLGFAFLYYHYKIDKSLDNLVG